MQRPDGEIPFDPDELSRPLTKGENVVLGVAAWVVFAAILVAALFGISFAETARGSIIFPILNMISSYRPAAIIIFLISVYALFKFKKLSQYFYGLVEVLVSVFTFSVFAFSYNVVAINTVTEWIVGFFGPVYIAVRGFSNMDEGKRKIAEMRTK